MQTRKTLEGEKVSPKDLKKEQARKREQWKLLCEQYKLQDTRTIKDRILFDNLMSLILMLMDPTFKNKVTVNRYRHEWDIVEDADNRFSDYLTKKAGLS